MEPGRPVPVGTPIIAIDDGGRRATPVPDRRRDGAAAPDARRELDRRGGPGRPDRDAGGLRPAPGRGAAAAPRRARPAAPRRAARMQQVAPPPSERAAMRVPAAAPATSCRCAKPPVRKLARDLGVDLHAVAGTGRRRGDHPRRRRAPPAAPNVTAAGRADAPAGDGARREPIRGVRRATAAAMVASAFTAPHVTEFLAVDVTATMALRDRLRASREYADVAAEPAGVRRQGGLPGAAPHPGAQRALGRAGGRDRLPRPGPARDRRGHAARADRPDDPRRRHACRCPSWPAALRRAGRRPPGPAAPRRPT